MTPQELKNSILQLAMQGRLVEQRPEEGTGEELYRAIQAEKRALIKAGKLKKEKPLPENAEEEKPFDIPESWMWVRFSAIMDSISTGPFGSMLHKEDYVSSGIPLVNPANIVNGRIIPSSKMMISEETRHRLSAYILSAGMIVMGRRGEMGRCAAVTGEEDGWLCGTGSFFISPNVRLYTYYITMLFSSPYAKAYLGDSSIGTTMSNLNHAILRMMPVPLPPLAEQKRIVAKIEELLPLIDRYEIAWSRLEDFNTRFPVDMQKSILQLAMQGKLVEQRPEEGTGEALYKMIGADREKLIKAGILKKDKRTNLPQISPDEVPFDIPETWAWVRLGTILRKLTDGTHKTPKYTPSGVKFVSVKDMSGGLLSLKDTKFISQEEHKELYLRCNPERGDMLLSKVGTTGVPAIVDTDEQFSLFVSVALLKYAPNCIEEKYLYYLLKSPLVQEQAVENTRGVGNKNWVLDAIANTIVVLPPLAEQKRIVAKIEELLPLCGRLK